MTLDVFLLAGPGENELVRRWDSMPNYGWSDGTIGARSILSTVVKGALLGIVYPLGGLPESGLGYHISSRVGHTWSRDGSGSEGVWFGLAEFTATTHEYSIEMRVESDAQAPYSAEFSSSMKSWVALDLKWQGNVW